MGHCGDGVTEEEVELVTHFVGRVEFCSSKNSSKKSVWVWPKNCPIIVLSNLHTTDSSLLHMHTLTHYVVTYSHLKAKPCMHKTYSHI